MFGLSPRFPLVLLWAALPCGVLIGRVAADTPLGAPAATSAANPDCAWMLHARYGIFMHYQYRILLGRSIRTKPQFPEVSEMTAEGWNALVDGFDVSGFAEQMADAKVGWVIFCL